MTTRRLWVPVLAALLVAALVGPSAVAAAEPRITTKSIMIPAAAFIPTTDNYDYGNGGNSLQVYSGTGSFAAPLSFPVPVVNIKKITLYAWDNDASNQLCVNLYRSRPVDGGHDPMGHLCTTDTSGPHYASTTTISPRRVTTAVQGAYLWVNIYAPHLWLYGVKVTYSY